MPVRVGVLTVSDRVSRGEMADTGALAIQGALGGEHWTVARQAVVADEQDQIAETLERWADVDHLELVFTTGGTGLGPRDVTPEATIAVAHRQAPGIAEAIRNSGLAQTPHAMLSRGVCVLRGETLIINLPGNPKGAADGVNAVLPVLAHAIAIMHGGRH